MLLKETQRISTAISWNSETLQPHWKFQPLKYCQGKRNKTDFSESKEEYSHFTKNFKLKKLKVWKLRHHIGSFNPWKTVKEGKVKQVLFSKSHIALRKESKHSHCTNNNKRKDLSLETSPSHQKFQPLKNCQGMRNKTDFSDSKVKDLKKKCK